MLQLSIPFNPIQTDQELIFQQLYYKTLFPSKILGILLYSFE
ncbi:hypothetical protein LEP1GSC008_3648 [Leptospira kirschneri serovar Bulgarica str. Nikolaevo]|uniref:Uncharacterized protein n=1 Tax=Leptospira kirschneri serovar Bulgarica str. Nikolaevo TaxID=1240687 RepID=M6FN96_9LEPT|nr:hypothetical protein LEP1GSC008_3648 [Leptospira kirschneri serovar Bulgarica str. Nikolaevo]